MAVDRRLKIKVWIMDGGWSWIVCAAAFITHTLTVGFSYAIGVYYVEFLTVFNESKGTTAWISSLNYGCLCGIGELVTYRSTLVSFKLVRE